MAKKKPKEDEKTSEEETPRLPRWKQNIKDEIDETVDKISEQQRRQRERDDAE